MTNSPLASAPDDLFRRRPASAAYADGRESTEGDEPERENEGENGHFGPRSPRWKKFSAKGIVAPRINLAHRGVSSYVQVILMPLFTSAAMTNTPSPCGTRDGLFAVVFTIHSAMEWITCRPPACPRSTR